MSTPFKKLTVFETYQGKKRVLVRPGISVFLYCDKRTQEIGPRVADAVAEYLEFIKPAILRTYLNNDGIHKPLSNKQITKDFKLLRNMPAKYEDYRLRYTESLTGNAGTHEVYYESFLDSHNKQREKVLPLKLNPFRMEFPYGIIDQVGIEKFISFIIKIAEILPFQSGNAGFAFQRDMSHDRDAAQAVVKLLPKYLGFDPSYSHASLQMKGHTLTAHWINLLNHKMIAKLGGLKAVKSALPTCDIREFKNGVLIRSAYLPPIGDVNDKLSDIGCLPDVARLLRPTRVKLTGLGLPSQTFDAMAWLARFDKMPSKK